MKFINILVYVKMDYMHVINLNTPFIKFSDNLFKNNIKKIVWIMKILSMILTIYKEISNIQISEFVVSIFIFIRYSCTYRFIGV